MNLRIACLLLLGIWVSKPAQADFEMPKHVYRMNELEKAKAEAAAKGEPLAIIYTTEKTTCGLNRSASLNAADRLKSKTVVVYAEWGDKMLPDVVREALTSPEAGKFIPRTVLVDAKMEKVLAVIPYALGDEQNKLIKTALRGVEKATAPTDAAPTARLLPAALPRDDTRALRAWTARSGSTLEARLLEQSGPHLVLQTAEGKQMKILPAQLSDTDQQYVQSLRGP
jgi:hypothetical protein